METRGSESTLTPCGSCGSKNLGKFPTAISIHFPGLKNIHRPQVLVFPRLLLCLACGAAQFTVGQPELNQLASPDV